MPQNVVFNGSDTALEIDIEFGDIKTSVFLQPKGRASLEESYQVTPLFLKLNPSVRQVSKTEFEAQKAMLTSRAAYIPAPPATPVAAVRAPVFNKPAAEQQATENKSPNKQSN